MAELSLIAKILQSVQPYAQEMYANRDALIVTTKAHANDLLTQVDVEIQRRITAQIAQAFPDDRIIGEESGMDQYPEDPNARCWVIDPIDGTQNFIRGMFPHFGISIAFIQDGEVQAGGVAVPMMQDIYLAQRGQDATRNGKALHVSKIDALELARVEIDFGNPQNRRDSLKRFSDIILDAGQLRCHCAAVIGLLSVAAADADAYLNIRLAPWDYAAAMLIAQEAGGQATRLDGCPIQLFGKDQSILTTNGRIHEETLAKIRC